MGEWFRRLDFGLHSIGFLQFNRSLPISLVVSDFQLNPGKTPPKITSIQLRHDEESFGNLSGRLELIADVQFWYGGNLEAFLTVKSKNEKDGEACTCYLHNFQVACEMRIVCKAPLEMLTVYTAAAFSMIGVPNIKFDTRVITGADLLDALDIRRLVMSTAHDFLACTCTMPKMTIVPFIPGLSTTDTVMKPPDGVLRIEIRSAILLEDCVPPKPFQSDQQYEDVFPALEPFIRVQIGNQVYFSQVGVRQFDSSWVFQEVFEFQVHDAATENLLITIYSGHRAELIKMEEDPSKFPASGDSPVIRPIGEPAPSRVMTKDIDSAIMRSMELSHIELSVANLGAQSLQEHCTVLNSGLGAKLLFNTYWYALSRDPMYMDMQADLSKDVENSNDIPWPVGLLLVYIDSARHCGFTGGFCWQWVKIVHNRKQPRRPSSRRPRRLPLLPSPSEARTLRPSLHHPPRRSRRPTSMETPSQLLGALPCPPNPQRHRARHSLRHSHRLMFHSNIYHFHLAKSPTLWMVPIES